MIKCRRGDILKFKKSVLVGDKEALKTGGRYVVRENNFGVRVWLEWGGTLKKPMARLPTFSVNSLNDFEVIGNIYKE